MHAPLTVACVQAEPVILDRQATIERVDVLCGEAARAGAGLVVLPESFVPAYPSSAWAKALAGWDDPRAKSAKAALARGSAQPANAFAQAEDG